MSLFSHATLERNSLILTIGILLVVSIGGIVQIAPLFFLNSTIEEVEGMRPYSPLELGLDPHWKGWSYILSAASE